jgi:hypothetical protein
MVLELLSLRQAFGNLDGQGSDLRLAKNIFVPSGDLV